MVFLFPQYFLIILQFSPCFWFCISASLVSTVCFHLWVCLWFNCSFHFFCSHFHSLKNNFEFVSSIVRYYMLSAAFNICLGPLFVLIFLFFLSFSFSFSSVLYGLWNLGAPAMGSGLKLWDRRPDPWWENVQPHGILIGKKSPKGLHLNHKTWPDTKASKLQCWTLHPKQLEKQE